MAADESIGFDEDLRLSALADYAVLDTPPEPEFDDIVFMASEFCNTPVALVSLVERDRQWFKARVGFSAGETPIDQSVCAHALNSHDLLVIPDLRLDPRTRNNSLVTAGPRIGFYAGAPLIVPGGPVVGTLCVIDTAPRPGGLTDVQARALQALARHVVSLLEMRRTVEARDQSLAAHRERNSRIMARAVAQEAAHEIVRQSDTRSRVAHEAGQIGTFEIDVATSVIVVSDVFCRIFGLPVAPTCAASVIEGTVHPKDRTVLSSAANRADGSAAVNAEYRIRRADDGQTRWIARRSHFTKTADGVPTKMIGTVQDITEVKASADRIAALLTLGDRLRDAETTNAIIAAAANILADTLDAVRAGYATIDLRAGTLVVEADWTAPDAQSVAGQHSTSVFPATMEKLRSGNVLVVENVATADLLQSDADHYAAQGVRSLVEVPFMLHGELVGTIFVHDHVARQWSVDELDFIRSVADRTYAAIAKVRAEDEQKILNGELSHRLKNTLAMVQGIAMQTLRSVPDQAPVDAFQQRLMALSRAHDALLQETWSAARILTIVEGMLSVHGVAERFEIRGHDIRIGPRASLSLAMLLHELATNAAKYGALSSARGRVALKWRVAGNGPEAELVLTWEETGGPPVVAPERKGFGSRLIQMGLVGSGGVETRYASDGLCARFSAPLSQVQLS